MKGAPWPALLVCLLAGCMTPYKVSLDPLDAGQALAIARSSPRWGHMNRGEAVQLLQDLYGGMDRVARATVTSTRIQVVCILDYPEAYPTREVAFDWDKVSDIAVYRQDWTDGRMTYDIHVRYTVEADDGREGGAGGAPGVAVYGIGHTLSGCAFPAAEAADILCALYVLTGKAAGAPGADAGRPGEEGTGPAEAPAPLSIESRLRQLRQLHKEGLITDEVLKLKQEEILKEL